LVEQLEDEQELPPCPAGDDVPEAQNMEINLLVLSEPHLGHETAASERETSSSNLFSQSLQRYS
jgi:hypothetical protein